MSRVSKSLTFLLAVTLFNITTEAKSIGLGIIVGEPTGISAKVWLGKRSAICGALGWSFEGRKNMDIQSDYILHSFNLIPIEKGELPIYYGIGGRAIINDNYKIALHIPLGIEYLFYNAPLDIFLEISPLMDLYPKTKFNITGSIGIRFLFGK